MGRPFLASIIISSYNYARFLRQAIDSAPAQTYPNVEVIVVDDCSTDESREIILGYGERIRPVLRESNKGGRATYNEACQLSRGDVIFLLDSDDVLCSTAVAEAMPLFEDRAVVNVQWPMWQIDVNGAHMGVVVPAGVLPDGDLTARVVRDGPWVLSSAFTSGNGWSRDFLERVLPIPAGVYADDYVSVWAYALGTVRSLRQPHGYYRVHGRNTYNAKAFDQRLAYDVGHVERCCGVLGGYYRERGIEVDLERWKRGSWICKVATSARDIAEVVPEAGTFVLVDQDDWGTRGVVAGRRALPFIALDGTYGGPPADSESAIAALERSREAGASHIVFAWPAFWWLDFYSGLKSYLDRRFRCVIQNERLRGFDLRGTLG